jgi:hypothetical protein
MKSWTIPSIPKTHNSIVGKHWKAAYGQKARWRKLIKTVCGERTVTKIYDDKCRVTIDVYRHTRQDVDNAWASCKPIFDALVRYGWLADDTPEMLESSVTEHVESDKKKQRTEITWEIIE